MRSQRAAREEDCRRVSSRAPRRPSRRRCRCHSLPSAPSRPSTVFLSGGGSNFKALHAAMLDGRIRGRCVAVVTDKPDCEGAGYARAHGLPVLRYPAPREQPSEGLSAPALLEELQGRGTELVLLAGYLRLVPPELCRAFPRALLNIHPALLPAFGGKGMYGSRVHAAVIASGARYVPLPLTRHGNSYAFAYISLARTRADLAGPQYISWTRNTIKGSSPHSAASPCWLMTAPTRWHTGCWSRCVFLLFLHKKETADWR